MPIDETKQADNLIISTDTISEAIIQNRFGAKHEVITDITPGRHLTILAVETDAMVAGEGYTLLEETLKSQFGVRAMQTVFMATIPQNPLPSQVFNVHITGHLRIEESY